ncbi:WD40 repeat-like protein [Sistotremastrum suecicum HHB10207 ss-3]|uniref:WD40 repeat-like protein n=1 Tax=Sistotremastrum suecicum HHB10207 ss-3 TaxID=1314776 RepID=A0A166ERS9_9AGAM|nr:WD40 repeat-like protein [Sistotremastrum suecicum HHB10207 ss-3]
MRRQTLSALSIFLITSSSTWAASLSQQNSFPDTQATFQIPTTPNGRATAVEEILPLTESESTVDFFRTYIHRVSRPFSLNGVEVSWADVVTNTGGGPLVDGQELHREKMSYTRGPSIVSNPAHSLVALSQPSIQMRQTNPLCHIRIDTLMEVANRSFVFDPKAYYAAHGTTPPDCATSMIVSEDLKQSTIRVVNTSADPQSKPILSFRLQGAVDHLGFSRDGRTFVASSSPYGGQPGPRIIALRSILRSPALKFYLDGFFSPFQTQFFSGDSTLLLYQPTQTTLSAWNITERKTLWSHSHANDIMDSSFNPNGTLVASSSWDHTVQIRNGATGDLIHDFTEAEGENWGLQFSPDGSLVACGSSDRTLRVWDVSLGKLVHSFPNFRGIVKAVSFSENGRYLAGGASTGQLRFFDLTNGDEIQRWEVDITGHKSTKHRIEATNLKWIGDDILAFQTTDGTITVHDMAENVKWEIERRWDGDREPGRFGVSVHPEGKEKGLVCVSRNADGSLVSWHLKRLSGMSQ